MRRFICMATILLTAGAIGADDAMEKLNAAGLLAKTVAATQKQDGYHVRLSGAAGPQQGNTDGVVRKELLKTTGTIEAFVRGASVVVKNTDGKWVTQDKADAQAMQKVFLVEHPNVLLNQALKAQKTATFDGDEIVEGVPCKKIACSGSKEGKKAAIEALMDRFKDLHDLGHFNSSMIDFERTTLTYVLYASAVDGLVHRMEMELRPVVDRKAGKGMAAQGASLRRRVDLYQYNGELDFEVPPEAAAKLKK